ncbi:MAG: hypothetical protein ABI859_02435 [Pseudomonadota bacterium]
MGYGEKGLAMSSEDSMRNSRLLVAGILLSVSLQGLSGEPAATPTSPSGKGPVTTAMDAVAGGKRYDVCPSCDYRELTTVPWDSLRPGSVVNVFYRPEPYRTKIALRVSGTAKAHVVINGVTAPDGSRPVISGDSAVTAAANRNTGMYNDEHPEYGEGLAVVLIKRSQRDDPYGYKPKFIDLKNLEIRSSYGRSYVAQNGQQKRFEAWAAGVWVDVVEDLLIENCIVTDHSFGIFVNNRNAERGVDAETSYRVTIRNSQVFGNGRVGSYYEHNLYVQAVGALYEGNFIGRLRPGAEGSSLKDRSAGTIVRYNYIQCEARCMDLVHDESGSKKTRESPTSRAADYDRAWVYGNLVVSDRSISMIHFGGDNLGDGVGPYPTYRNGPLYVFHNTFVFNVDEWRSYVFDVQHAAGTVEAYNNVVYFGGKSTIRAWMNTYGTLNLHAGNWAQEGIVPARDGPTQAKVNQTGALLSGAGLTPDYRLRSPQAGAPLPSVLDAFPVDRVFNAPGGTAPRNNANVGAF